MKILKYIGLIKIYCNKTETSEALKAAKIERRSAKASLTRLGKALNILSENERPVNEIRDYFVTVTQAFNNVVLKHESYANNNMISVEKSRNKQSVGLRNGCSEIQTRN